MKTPRSLIAAACIALATPTTAAASSAYDLFIIACDNAACNRVAEQTVSSGLANIAQYNGNGLRLMIETLARRTNEEDTRVSLNVRAADDGGVWRTATTAVAQRLEVIQCTLRHGAFRPLTTFVNDGRTYQIWARLARR